MPEFLNPVDIGNRALQHCGAEMMDATLGFADGKPGRQVGFVYGKLRRAELRRNVWRFATRRVVVRAIDSNTMLVDPSIWSASVTYFVGSIVADSTGTLWVSRLPNNLNFQPGTVYLAWEPYFGPMTASLYDSTQGYFSGEVVYTMAGDGTFNVYVSLTNNNALDPSLPNQWSGTTTYMQNDVVQQFAAWSNATTYAQGQAVLYTDGNYYASLTNGNLNHIPVSSPTFWALMPVEILASLQVPVTSFPTIAQTSPVGEWSINATYALGAFVMFNGIQYLSTLANNTGNFPNVAASTFWEPVSGGISYMSLIDLNLGNNPANAPAMWASGTTYAINNLVGVSDGYIYKSLINSNLANNPLSSPLVWQNTGVLNPWTSVFVQGRGNSQWVQVGGASFPDGVDLAQLNIVYPIGTGPVTQTATNNVYRLPSGWLRRAPEDPKAGGFSFLGVPGNIAYDDYKFEGNYLVTAVNNPIMLRFVADVQDVTAFDDMFCEGLAARIALEVCEPLTQSASKLKTIGQEYEKFMTEARTENAIEIGAEEQPLDDWLACRI